MSDPRKILFEKIAIEDAKVRPFDGFIFLCGGLVDATSHHPRSLRDAICREAVKHPHIESRIRLAEEFKEWADDGHYQDLLTFEEHIAELSEVIVLALESPGAIAELGLFSAMDSFRSKLIVFVATSHYEQPSFIKLGPIKFLENSQGNTSEVFPWITGGMRQVIDTEWLQNSSSEIFESVLDRIKPSTSDTPFNPEKWLHTTLLACDLIFLMSALTITEISNYLTDLGIDEPPQKLRQRLFILQKMGVISVIARSNQRFYVSAKGTQFLSFKISPKELDLSRFQTDVIGFYEKNDKKRYKAIIEGRKEGHS